MLTKYEWVNHTKTYKEPVLEHEKVLFLPFVPKIRGVIERLPDNSLFISFAFTPDFKIKDLMKTVYEFKKQYGHLKWVANVKKDSIVCRNFAKKLGFIEKHDILLEDDSLIYIERLPDHG